MVLEAPTDDLKHLLSDITAHADATKGAESAFYKDLRYEFLNARERHSEAAYRLIMGFDGHRVADHSSAETFSLVATEHGARFVDAILPRYEIAVRAQPDLGSALRDDWVGTVGYLIEAVTLDYETLDWIDNGEFLRVMMMLTQMRLEQRIDHAIRGLVIEPKHPPKWHERHPVAYAVVLLAIGAMLSGVVEAVVKALTGS